MIISKRILKTKRGSNKCLLNNNKRFIDEHLLVKDF